MILNMEINRQERGLNNVKNGQDCIPEKNNFTKKNGESNS